MHCTCIGLNSIGMNYFYNNIFNKQFLVWVVVCVVIYFEVSSWMLIKYYVYHISNNKKFT
jgi:hypothetical protein